MAAQREQFIAISYEKERTFSVAEALAASFALSGIPTWLLRGITGKELPTGEEGWRNYEANWQAVWLERVRDANGIILLVAVGGFTPHGSGVWNELRFIRSLETNHPERVQTVTLPSMLRDDLRPRVEDVRVSPLGEERVGYDRARESAVAQVEAEQREFDRKQKEWMEAVLDDLEEWAKQVLQLPPIGDQIAGVIGDAGSDSAPGNNATTAADYNVRDWVGRYSSRLKWGTLADIDLYDVVVFCAACGAEWRCFPQPPPTSCPKCSYRGGEVAT